ncbi:Hypothetical predicted protein, partial [Marmota monax]
IGISVYSMEENGIGKYVIAMAVTGFLYILLIFLLDTVSWNVRALVYRSVLFGIFKKINKETVSKEFSGESDDEDVQNERQRIVEQPLESLNSTVVIKELTKIYFQCPPILAVRNISVAIQEEECFGLLGLNGAGKTSTFQILTGEHTATSGDVFIKGFSITKNILKVRSKIGYCPQFDALLDHMTVQETMIMYARLWGIPENNINSYVNDILKLLNLQPHANKRTQTLSMEECEALCTRLAIMVQGKFRCLGSPQHLKNKFGDVYTMFVKFKTGTDQNIIEDFKIFIASTFRGSALKQETQGVLNFYIPSKENSWGKVFGILEKAKEQFDLEDYSVSQITLEQVFLTFANVDKPAGGSENGLEQHSGSRWANRDCGVGAALSARAGDTEPRPPHVLRTSALLIGARAEATPLFASASLVREAEATPLPSSAERRKLVALVVEIILTILFGIILLAICKFIIIKKIGPFSYNAHPINDLPSFIRSPVTVSYPWELAYVPSKSIVVQNIVENVKRDLNTNLKVIGFSSERAFEDYVEQTNNSKNVLAAIVFDHVFQSTNDPLPLKVKYYLRFSSLKKNNKFGGSFEASSWLTNFLFPSVPPVGPRNQQEEDGGSPGYISEGFLLVQHALDKAIMLHHSGTAAEKLFNGVRIFVQRFPYPMQYQDFFYVFAGIFIPLVTICIFSLNHLILIQSIVWEKENRLK